jgi:hypothetical protein
MIEERCGWPNGHRLKNTENDGSIAGYEELLNLGTERKKAEDKNDIYERVVKPRRMKWAGHVARMGGG